MPRISAPTLVEHRAQQRAVLLDAARALIVEGEASSITMAAVAARAGLARSSVYDYFASPADLLATIVADDLTDFAAEMTARLAKAEAPAQRVQAFVRSWLRYVAAGRNQVTAAILATPMPEECHAAVAMMHRRIAEPLIDALGDLGVADPAGTADLIRGVVEAAARRIAAGGSPRRETAAAEQFVARALRS